MMPRKACDVAARALQAVGTPFRLYGRKVDIALDCVGLILFAIGDEERATDYHLKGDYLAETKSIANQIGYLDADSPIDGDIAMVDCGVRQQHLMVRASKGWVHAHAGLGRVVHTPGPSHWPILALWRSTGD